MVVNIDKISSFLLLFVVLIIAISYYPVFYASSTLYSIFRAITYIVIILVVMLNFSLKKIFNIKFLRTLLLLLILIFLEFFVFFALGLNFEFSDFWQLIIVFLSIVIGVNYGDRVEDLKRLLIFYALIGVGIGLISFNYYKADIDSMDVYAVEGKNQLGLIVSTASAISLYLGIYYKKFKQRILFIAIYLIGFLILFLMSARSATFGLLLYSFVFLFKFLSFKAKFAILVLAIFLSIAFSTVIVEMFIGNHDVADLNSLSSGRIERNLLGVAYVKEHFWDGELYQKSYIPWIHNYLLLRVVRYGIWAVFLLCFYFYILFNVIRQIYHSKKIIEITKIAPFFLIIPYFISMLEPSAPFGPGSNVFILYIIYGTSIAKDYLIKKI